MGDRLGDLNATSSASITQKLSGLEDLHNCAEKLLQLPLTRKALRSQRRRATHQGMRTRDPIHHEKKKRGSLESEIKRYSVSRKVVKKAIQKALRNLKSNDSKNAILSASNKDIETMALAGALGEVETATLAVFESLLCFVSGPKSQYSKLNSWSLVSKLLMQSKKIGCEEEEKAVNEFENVDSVLQILIQSDKCPLNIENVQTELQCLESCIQNFEERLDRLFRGEARVRDERREGENGNGGIVGGESFREFWEETLHEHRFPTRPHPLFQQCDEHLCRLGASDATSSSSVSLKLSGLEDLHDSVEKLFQLPLTQQAFVQGRQEKWVDELVDGTLRKRGAEVLGLVGEVKKYMASRKVVKKAIRKALDNMKAGANYKSSSSNKESSAETMALISVLKEVEAVTLSIFESLLCFVSGPKSQTMMSGWSLVSKLVYKKKVSCDQDDDQADANEFAKADEALQCLMYHETAKFDNTTHIENVQNELHSLESCVQDFEERLESSSVLLFSVPRNPAMEATLFSSTSFLPHPVLRKPAKMRGSDLQCWCPCFSLSYSAIRTNPIELSRRQFMFLDKPFISKLNKRFSSKCSNQFRRDCMNVDGTSAQFLNVEAISPMPNGEANVQSSHQISDYEKLQSRPNMFRNRFLNFVRFSSVLNNAAESFFKSEIRRRLRLIPQDYLSFASGTADELGDFTGELKLSLFQLGVGPQIIASIIMQVLCHVVPSLVKLRKEGLDAQEKIKSYIWWMSLGFAIVEALIVSCYSLPYSIYVASHRVKHVVITSLFLVCGAMTITWICDTISESGFGQGSSLIICVGILTGYTEMLHNMLSRHSGISFPNGLDSKLITPFQNYFKPLILEEGNGKEIDRSIMSWGPYVLGLLGVFTLVTMWAVVVTEGCRKVKLQYYGFKLASAARDDSPVTEVEPYIPFNINPAGMQPVLTTNYLLAVPSILASLLSSPFWEHAREILNPESSIGAKPWVYYSIYAFFVFLFNIFDIANLPKEISDYLNKMGARIPNVKPGNATIEYLTKIQASTRFWGGVLLSFLATSSTILDHYLRRINAGFAIGFTSILIIVGSIIELRRSYQAYNVMPSLSKALRRKRKMAAYHVRSNSFPSKQHPLISEFDGILRSSTEASSSTSITSKLNGLQDLHDCVDKLLLLPLNQQALSKEHNEKSLNEILDGSLRLLDICNTAKDALLLTKESTQELQSILRRRRSGEMELTSEIKKFLASRKMMKKTLRKALENKTTFSSLKKEQVSSETVSMLREVESMAVTVLESLLSFISGPKSSSSWSLVTKMMNTKRVGAEDANESNEFTSADAALNLLITAKKVKKSDSSLEENVQKQLQNLELCIEDLEQGVESLYRRLIKKEFLYSTSSITNSLQYLRFVS
ncbi:hypothetical protein G4B88_008604 [Cannabis sativa]|uniref:Uncharacterized protein n=1 Tax=Cannabis sativa TaxID=3483 RepID=A0A7J6FEU2_CANSA|nr:hypothetical protein G4B88_008604 [Cannabis sativa]